MPDASSLPTSHLLDQATAALNQILFDYTLPVAVIVSYLRLLALARPAHERQTPPLDIASELPLLLGLQRTQVRKHISLLRMAKLIDWSTDSAGRYCIRFLLEQTSAATFADSGVVGVHPQMEPVQEDTQQQQTEVAKAACPGDERAPAESGAAHPPDAGGSDVRQTLAAYGVLDFADAQDWQIFDQVMRWLARAGVWTDQSVRIARRIAENERRGHEYLPGRGDVLGWTAYCFAYHHQNQVNRPVRVLAANLLNNRRCPDSLRARRICAGCRFQEGFCQCQGEPQYFYPDEFLEFSFNTNFDPDRTNFWGVCHTCHAFRCQCPNRQVDQEMEAGEDEQEEAEQSWDPSIQKPVP
jgi:hypothetical protein